jgi:hypothetical protein
MKEEKTIHQLLNFGFKDESSINNVRLYLNVNGFSLYYEEGRFRLEGNGGYDYAGELELDHLQIEDIKPLYKLLTGKPLEEIHVAFNYAEWRDKLQKAAAEREESRKQFLKDNPIYGMFLGNNEVGFLDFLEKSSSNKVEGTTIVWQERSNLNSEDTL